MKAVEVHRCCSHSDVRKGDAHSDAKADKHDAALVKKDDDACSCHHEEANVADAAATIVTVEAPPAANPGEPPAPMPIISYKTPKNLLLAITKAGMAKGKLVWWKVAIMGFMAGMYIGVGGLLSAVVSGGAAGLGAGGNPGIQKFLGAAVFPLGLMLVVIAGGELFTGNIMYLTAAKLGNKVTWRELLRNWVVSYFFNFLGSLFMAYFLAYVPEIMHKDPYHTYIKNVADNKTFAEWHVNLMRGIGCNWLVCASLMFALCADDLTGKILALWFPVMGFITIGYEHSVANMFMIPLGMMEGAQANVGEFIGRNLIPVTIGNMIGGFLFTTLAEWLVFSDYFGERLQAMSLKQGSHPEKTKHASLGGTTVLHVTTPHPAGKAPTVLHIATPQVPRSVKHSVKKVVTTADVADIASGAPQPYVNRQPSGAIVTITEPGRTPASVSKAPICYKCGHAPGSAECKKAWQVSDRSQEIEMQLPGIEEVASPDAQEVRLHVRNSESPSESN